LKWREEFGKIQIQLQLDARNNSNSKLKWEKFKFKLPREKGEIQMSQHTPTKLLTISEQMPGLDPEERRLIAAAPTLLAAVEVALHFIETPGDFQPHERNEIIEDLSAAIAQAKLEGQKNSK
jgi:hypothetical protein